MKILITGGNGLLAPYIVEACSSHEVSTTTREGCDLTNRASVKALLSGSNPDVIINCAALTDIDECEREPFRALESNRDIPYQFVEQMDPKAKFVQISTDMVYPDIRGPHREGDTGPVNMYGRSKLAGEKAAAINQRHLILRTNFFGESKLPWRQSFSDWVIQSLTEGRTEVFFNDVWFNPLHMKTLSALILRAVEEDLVGTYNVGAREGVSKVSFARMVCEHKGLGFCQVAVGPAHYRTKRPHDLTMDCTKIAEKGYGMPTVQEEIEKL